eukprot:scaffold8.g1356.t1
MAALSTTQGAALAGTRLQSKAQRARPSARMAMSPMAVLAAGKKPAQATGKNFRRPPPPYSPNSRVNPTTPQPVLTPGKDIKATQFTADLGFTKKQIAVGFTKSNELFVGRAAMLGFSAALIGEVLTGVGPLHQLGYEFHESLFDVEWEILGVIALNVIAAFLPAKGKFIPDDEELVERPKGALQDPSISALDWKRFLGISGKWGFTKENELFVGRMAQLGFAAALLGEALTGKGILGQIGLETGLPLSETEPLLLAFVALTATLALSPSGSGKFVDEQ